MPVNFSFSYKHSVISLKKRFLYTSDLREMPCLLFHVGHLFTVEELRKVADLIVHHTTSVLTSAA